MSIFNQMVDAVENYPVESVQLEIVEVTVPNQALNVNEVASFRVKVTNQGPLELTNLKLKITGLNGALVANNGAAAPFVDEFVTQELPTIGPHGGSQLTVGSPLKFKAPSRPQGTRDLVKASLDTWNCSIDRILSGHSKPSDPPRALHADDVLAS